MVNLRPCAHLTKEVSSSEDELDDDTKDFDPQESNNDDLSIQPDDEPKKPLDDDVKETFRVMKEMMKALYKRNEKCRKQIKDLQQRLDLLIFCAHTVVWEKLAVGNIHEKKICGKNFSS